MKNWILALCTGALLSMPAAAADAAKSDDMLSHLIISASADSWNVPNGAVRDDAEIKGGKAMRVTVHKSVNPWDVQAMIAVPQAVQKGDIMLVAFYARVETPPAGSTTAVISQAGIQINKAPYTAFAAEPAAPNGKWGIYYTSGTVDADHAKNTLVFVLHLASADQVIDLGPVFMFNLGPDWNRAKLPHNRLAAAAPAAPTATTTGTVAEAPYAPDLTKLRAKLPVKGVLINDPGQIYSYGPDLSMQSVAAPDVTGGTAKRFVIAKAGTNTWDDGASSPIGTAIKKGDVIFTAVQVRLNEAAPGNEASVIPELGVHLASAPYTPIATSSTSVPKGKWTWVFASGVAAADFASGTTGFGIQLGANKQTLDIGAVYVLNLGPGVDTAALPNNFGKGL